MGKNNGEILIIIMLKILKELFYMLTGALVVFAVLELAHPGIVLAYVNYSILLLFWLIVGIVIVLKNKNYGK